MPARPPRKKKRAIDRFKGMSCKEYRPVLRNMAVFADEYAGIPMPLEGEELIIHPSYKYADVFKKKRKENAETSLITRNHWRSLHGWNCIIIQDTKTGKIWGGKLEPRNRAVLQVNTMGLSCVWDIECERRAVAKLQTLVNPHIFAMYELTGAFLETSPRSKLTYMFRRLRPTLALSARTGAMRVIAALCMHPIGFYSGTWGGSMVPTDEVVAHLMMMRGDEKLFWKLANQHPAEYTESGL